MVLYNGAFFCFLDNCTWIGYGKFSLLQRNDLSSGVNVLKKQSVDFTYY